MVIDTSAVVDFLLGDGVASEIEGLLVREGGAAAPELLVFEVVAVLRRHVLRGAIDAARAGAAVDDLGDVAIDYYAALPLRARAWELRENLTAADGLFVALAEQLGEPLATKDRSLIAAARAHASVEVLELGAAA